MRVAAFRVCSAALIGLALLVPSSVVAQSASASATVREAERLRNAGDLVAAVGLLERHLATQPHDVHAIRLLAQSQYWLQELTRARAVYEDALRRHPNDVGLRLDYARMLLETRDARLRDVLAPLIASGHAAGDVHAILGTDAYWDGDYATARRLLRAALAAGSGDASVQRQLDEIRVLSAPWVRITPTLWHDDQPLDRLGIDVAAGWFLTPLVPVQARVAADRYSHDATRVAAWTAEGRLGAYLPDARLDVAAAGGFVQRTYPETSRVWTGLASAGVRLTPGVSVGGRISRASYFSTLASLHTPVTFVTIAGQLRLDTRGWLGEAEHRRQRYFDGNTVRTSYVWVLAPVVRRARATVQAGYAGAASTADALRFVAPASDSSTVPPDGVTVPGQYAPYHTPINQTSHSLAAALAVTSARGAIFRASGSAALTAAEDAPFIQSTGGRLETSLSRRDFSPWTLRASTDQPLDPSWTMTIAAETGRAAFYRWTTASVHLIHRFGLGSRAVAGR